MYINIYSSITKQNTINILVPAAEKQLVHNLPEGWPARYAAYFDAWQIYELSKFALPTNQFKLHRTGLSHNY